MSSDVADGEANVFEEEDVYESHSQLRAIFGPDIQTVFDIIAGRRPHTMGTDEYMETEGTTTSHIPEEKVDESSAQDDIALVDEPERLHTRYQRRPKPVPDEILEEEAEWLTSEIKKYINQAPVFNLGQDGGGLFDDFSILDLYNDRKQRERYDLCFKKSGIDPEDEHFDEKLSGEIFLPKDKSIEFDVKEKILQCLRMLLNERVDVPFICVHRAHMLFPPLTPEAVWLIFDLDEKFWRLRELRETVLQVFLERGDDAHAIANIRQIDDESLLRDYLNAEQSRKPPPTPGSKRRRGHLTPEQMFNKYFTETGVRSTWFDRLISPSNLVAGMQQEDHMDIEDAMESSSDPTLSISHPPAPDGLDVPLSDSNKCKEIMNDWIKAQIQAKNPDEKLVINDSDLCDMVIRFEGCQFAGNPEFRELVRKAFYRDSTLTTITTLKGEKMIDPGSPEWLASRLFNKPISQLWLPLESAAMEEPPAKSSNCPWEKKFLELENQIESNQHRELGLLVDQCEKDNLINVLVHPLIATDPIPWSKAYDSYEEDRWSRTDGEYVTEREKLQFIVEQDYKKTRSYIDRFARPLAIETRDTPWKWFVYGILERAILHELIPVFRNEIRLKLTEYSQEYVNLVCRTRFMLQLSVKGVTYDLMPTENPTLFPDFAAIARTEVDDMADVLVQGNSRPNTTELSGDEVLGPLVPSPLVYALVIEPDGDCTKSAPVHLVMANRETLLVKSMVFPGLLEYVLGGPEATRPKDFETLMLSLRTRPNVIVIPLINSYAVDLFNYMKNLVDSRLRYAKHGWQVVFVPPTIPLLAANKSSSTAICSTPTAIGLSAVRYAVDPVYEVANLWEEGETNPVLSIGLHYLQNKVPAERRLESLRQVIIRAVNTAGVFPNRMRVLGHLTAALPFVSGLGPIKAKRILQALQQPLSARETLLGLEDKTSGGLAPSSSGDCVMGKHVFLSCASFLRLQSSDELFNDRYTELDPLDDTRIHPIEEYATARKMCRDAQDEDNDGEDKGHTLEETLEDLDLEAYAYILGEGGRPRMLPHLEWLKMEMIKPFNDPRIAYKNMPLSYILRTLVADETKCRPTASVQLLVESLSPEPQLLVLPSNVFGKISDSAGGLTKGQIVRARLEKLNNEQLNLQCVTTGKGIGSLFERYGPQLYHDSQTLSPLIVEDIQVAKLNRGRRVIPSASQRTGKQEGASRHIKHPCMSKLSHRELLFQLSNMNDPALSVGSVCKFRIGQQRDNLILYMLVHHKPFRYKSIPIEERGVSKDGVASELFIQGIGSYTSLNEIIARPCSSFLTFVRDVTRHEKFDPVNSLDELLNKTDGSKAQWNIILDPSGAEASHRFQEKFYIVTVSRCSRTGEKRVIKDPLVVTPNGYRIWSQQSSSLQHLLNWYKTKGFVNAAIFCMQTATPWLPAADSSSQPDGEVVQSLRAMEAALDKLGAPLEVIDLNRLPRPATAGKHTAYDESETRRARRAYLKLQLASSPIQEFPTPDETLRYLQDAKLWRRSDIELPCLADWAFIEEVDQRKQRYVQREQTIKPKPSTAVIDPLVRNRRPESQNNFISYDRSGGRSPARSRSQRRSMSGVAPSSSVNRWRKRNVFFDAPRLPETSQIIERMRTSPHF